MARAQVTVFILTGMFILIVLGIVAYNLTSRMTAPTPDIAKPVSEFLSVCADEASQEAVRIVSRQGGYYNPPKESTLLNGFVIADYYRDAPRVPGMDTVNKELADAALEEFSSCDLSSLRELGYDVTIGTMQVKAHSSGIGVRFRFSYDAAITGEDISARVLETESFVPVELAKSHSIASRFIEEQAKDPRYVPLAYLSDLCVSNLLAFRMQQDSGRIVYSIFNPNKKLKGEPYTYAFAVDYGEERAYLEQREVIETPVLAAPVGKEFYLKLEFTEAYAYTEMFNATKGEISFIPRPEDLGLHDVLVIANTTSGWKTIKMKINVTEGIA